ncbi:MAG: PilZ domain-containing protein [Desulfobacteraceae bacterium]|nr:PilZ domain-containing protein [Desulfobacteraceae bacterium]
MNALDSQIDQYKVTARLFNFINDLPQDKQYILYKQLIKGNVVTEIFKLVIDMDEDEKLQLYERLGEIPYEEEPIRTINLDENESFMRENNRKVCQIPVKCKVENRSFKSYIIDISTVAALIESNDRFPIGQQISMDFRLPNHPHAMELKGRIVRSGPRGIAVKYDDLKQIDEELIRLFIKNIQ